MYSIIKSFLFLFSPEKAHKITFNVLKFAFAIPGKKAFLNWLYSFKNPGLNTKIGHLTFQNPVGLAAGFDKDAHYLNQLDAFGFGFIEIGTVTPKPQDGNPKPRLFRLVQDKAIINRMGFNNEGVELAAARLKKYSKKVIIGGNIGKNKVTPNELAFQDYEYCLKVLNPYVDYFVVNLSSPNTPGLRDLQEKEPLKQLLNHCKSTMKELGSKHPLFLKIAPDLTEGQLNDIIEIVQELELDGLVATNTTIDRSKLSTAPEKVDAIGNGGLSGAPLTNQSNSIIQYLRKKLPKPFPIIAVGGIMTPEDAVERIRSGATLLQVYTGFIYNGPSLIKNINKAILKELNQNN